MYRMNKWCYERVLCGYNLLKLHFQNVTLLFSFCKLRKTWPINFVSVVLLWLVLSKEAGKYVNK